MDVKEEGKDILSLLVKKKRVFLNWMVEMVGFLVIKVFKVFKVSSKIFFKFVGIFFFFLEIKKFSLFICLNFDIYNV